MHGAGSDHPSRLAGVLPEEKTASLLQLSRKSFRETLRSARVKPTTGTRNGQRPKEDSSTKCKGYQPLERMPYEFRPWAADREPGNENRECLLSTEHSD